MTARIAFFCVMNNDSILDLELANNSLCVIVLGYWMITYVVKVINYVLIYIGLQLILGIIAKNWANLQLQPSNWFPSPSCSIKPIITPKKSPKVNSMGKPTFWAAPFFGIAKFLKSSNLASERSTELNNHLKMFRRFTLWGTNQGFKVLRPSVFELWATPFFRTSDFGRKLENQQYSQFV